jgi:hypothetical protein
MEGAARALIVIVALAALMWPAVFMFVFDERARAWLGRRWNDRIYRSGPGGHWKSRAGRMVGHIQVALLFGPVFAWLGLVVLAIVALRAAGIAIR